MAKKILKKADFEACSCDEALFYKKIGRSLAHRVMRYATHEDQHKYGTVYYLAENIVPIAEALLKAKGRRTQ